MSLTRHTKIRPFLIAGVAAVVVGGSGAAWACNSLLGSDVEVPTTTLSTNYTQLASASSDERTSAESKAARSAAAQKKHSRSGSATTSPVETSRPDDTASPDDVGTTSAASAAQTTDPAQSTSPAEATDSAEATDAVPTTSPAQTTSPEQTASDEPTGSDETTSSDSPGSPAPSESEDGGLTEENGFEQEVVELVNEQREAAGCPALEQDDALTAAALAHTERGAEDGSLSHRYAGEEPLGYRITAAEYTWSAVGENIAVGYSDPEAVMAGWMNSAGHRENILNCSFEDIGVAAVTDASGRIWWTQDFGAAA